MIRTKLQAPVSVTVRRAATNRPLRVPDDVYLSTVRDTTHARIANAPMVFVGYGVTAPERDWDDFKGVDLNGKMAVFLGTIRTSKLRQGRPSGAPSAASR